MTASAASRPGSTSSARTASVDTTTGPVQAPHGSGPPVESITVSVYTIPTDSPESDGTYAWDATTLVVVEPVAGGVRGLGYSYADAVAGRLVADLLGPATVGRDAFDVAGSWSILVGAVRNIGRQGIAATAISALDNGLWDLKAKLLGVSLVDLLGRARESIPGYGSGGFCTYDDGRLTDQLGDWAAAGFGSVKMKIGRDRERDRHRVDVARSAVGPGVELYVDANGAYDRGHALGTAAWLAERQVTWFEEPVSSDDVAGLRLIRDRAPAGMAIAAGEYGWGQFAFRGLLEAGAVDVLQADATRCLGTTGFQIAAALCEANNVPLSAHCAPALHVQLTCAAKAAMNLEWFHDHVRIEHLLFDGAPDPHDGDLAPDRTRPGLGLGLKVRDAEPFLRWRS